MWDFFEPKDRLWYRWMLDGAEAFLRKNGDEWRIAFRSVPFEALSDHSGGPEAVEAPEDCAVSFVVGRGKRVALRPHLSEMPYLIVARDDVRILPGSESRFQVALPPVVRFETEGGDVLAESMPFTLSNTWFGDKSGGTLCISMPTALDPRCRGEIEESDGCGSTDSLHGSLDRSGALVHCEIVVRNDSIFFFDM